MEWFNSLYQFGCFHPSPGFISHYPQLLLQISNQLVDLCYQHPLLRIFGCLLWCYSDQQIRSCLRRHQICLVRSFRSLGSLMDHQVRTHLLINQLLLIGRNLLWFLLQLDFNSNQPVLGSRFGFVHFGLLVHLGLGLWNYFLQHSRKLPGQRYFLRCYLRLRQRCPRYSQSYWVVEECHHLWTKDCLKRLFLEFFNIQFFFFFSIIVIGIWNCQIGKRILFSHILFCFLLFIY